MTARADDLTRYKQEDFEDANPFEKPTQEDYDFIEDYDNFEDNIDDDMNRQDIKAFTNQILFCVQELG